MGMFERKRKALRVRLQHAELDNAAIEGVWVGEYDRWLHIRAARTILENVAKPVPHGEILVHRDKVVFLEVLSEVADAHPDAFKAPGAADS